jgi:hypothetical protein
MTTYKRLSVVAPLHLLGHRSIDPRGKTQSRAGQQPHNSQEEEKKRGRKEIKGNNHDYFLFSLHFP